MTVSIGDDKKLATMRLCIPAAACESADRVLCSTPGRARIWAQAAAGYGRGRWIVSFEADALTAAATRGALLARSAASGQRIYAVHFPFPGLGKIEGRTDGFVWVP